MSLGIEGNQNFADIFSKMEQERNIAQAEREVRYANRRNNKVKRREAVEQTADRLCAAINEALKEELKPGDLAALAAALQGTVLALQTAENYAESIPLTNSAVGLCAV